MMAAMIAAAIAPAASAEEDKVVKLALQGALSYLAAGNRGQV